MIHSVIWVSKDSATSVPSAIASLSSGNQAAASTRTDSHIILAVPSRPRWRKSCSVKRITITIEEGLYDKLPAYGKSGVVNLILKQHFQQEGADKLFETIKGRLFKDKEFNAWLEATVSEIKRYGW